MRHYPIICAMLLGSCGHEVTAPLVLSAPIAADLLTPCAGWQGPSPTTEGQLIDAASAERTGRLQCNAKLKAINTTVFPPTLPQHIGADHGTK